MLNKINDFNNTSLDVKLCLSIDKGDFIINVLDEFAYDYCLKYYPDYIDLMAQQYPILDDLDIDIQKITVTTDNIDLVIKSIRLITYTLSNNYKYKTNHIPDGILKELNFVNEKYSNNRYKLKVTDSIDIVYIKFDHSDSFNIIENCSIIKFNDYKDSNLYSNDYLINMSMFNFNKHDKINKKLEILKEQIKLILVIDQNGLN